jgi:6-phosphogluconolactonase (cycloisomerase 2 family)
MLHLLRKFALKVACNECVRFVLPRLLDSSALSALILSSLQCLDLSGRYIVVANQGDNSLSLLEPLGAPPTPATSLAYTPLTISVDGTGSLFFVAGTDSKLHMLFSNGLGTLTEVETGTLPDANTASVAVDPLSRFVYAAGPGGVTAFAMDTTKQTLTPISLDVSIPLANATGVFVDPSGSFLYVGVSGGSTKALYLFAVNPNGTLTAGKTNPVATPNHVTSIVFRAQVQ